MYLITGGCGFIGSTLARALRAVGATVLVVDDLSSGDRTRVPPDVELVEGDVRDGELMRRLVDRVDGVFHLAAVASVERCNQDLLDSHLTNGGGTVSVLQAARGRAVPVVWASSAAVYGDQSVQPISESAAVAPLSPYGVDKYAGELHAAAAASLFGVPSIGLRFFNVYGPGQDPRSPYSGVVSIFMERALQRQQVVINGDGSASRDFVYVGDVVRVLIRAMEWLREHAAAPAQARVLNVCTGQATSIGELFAHVRRLTGATGEATHGPARTGDIKASVGAPEALLEVLGIRCDTAIREGLKRTLAAMNEAGPKGGASGVSS